MTDDTNPTAPSPAPAPKKGIPLWAGLVILALTAVAVALVGLLAVSIGERRQEALRPGFAVNPVGEWETDPAAWGLNYPNEYDTYKATADSTTRTKFGGAAPRDYLDEDPNQVILFAGFGFGKDYKQARGHMHAVEDVVNTKRVKNPTPEHPDVFHPATCWTCKSPDVPSKMAALGREKEKDETDPLKQIAAGAEAFYASNFHDLKKDITHPIGCLDCHDPKTMKLRITRPALREAMASIGRDVDQASHQEMRSLVCAQCHVQYYFKTSPKNYLKFPWEGGHRVEDMLAYYEKHDGAFADWTHPISKTPILKCRHPDYEMYSTGVHAYRNVSCADCHMPYRTAGGAKFTDHHIQSPLLNIANSCAVCHRWSESDIRERVESIQAKVHAAKLQAEDALVKAHFDVAAAMQAGASDDDLAPARALIRTAQFRWDYVSANNGMGFHSPQESMRILGDAARQAMEVRLLTARLLKGVAPVYPDVSTRATAAAVAKTFVDGQGVKLLP
ncbi:MAG: ammonia-forming cytochrome c nitrite reductase subunit c552 [Planctomycetota bacterium]|nr:ammonia-forming cytochrome c nitrite reductase subunit c552 [Planctomycetota bacterium]